MKAKEKKEKLRGLRKLLGVGVVRSLQLGKSTLQIWRRTSPHNWWVENSKGDMLWHVGEDRKRPSLEMFELVKNSAKRIITGCPQIVGSDEGRPEQSFYRLKRQYCV